MVRAVRRSDCLRGATVSLIGARFFICHGVPEALIFFTMLNVRLGSPFCWLAFAVLGFCHLASVHAQTADGRAVQEKPGFALVKPQPWSRDDQATVMEFLAFTDRSVKTSPGAGYFEFRTSQRPAMQIPAARVVRLVVFPEIPKELITAEQRAELTKIIQDLEEISKRYPSTARVLKPSIEQLRAEEEKYDGGFVKEEGQWVARAAYFKRKAASLVELARGDIDAAPDIKDFDLSLNQYYRGLRDLAGKESSFRPLAEGVRVYYESKLRGIKRDGLLKSLAAPGVTDAQAEALVTQLRGLQPTEDAKAALFLTQWDTAKAKAGELTAQIAAAQLAFEATMPTDPNEAVTIPEAVVAQVRQVGTAVQQYRAGNPPTAIKVPVVVSDAMGAMIEILPKIQKEISERKYLDAKSRLDTVVRNVSQIGPKSTAVVSAMQKQATVEIEKFVRLRDEAKMLADADKIEEAIKKYEEAFAVVPEADIAKQIEALKKQ